MQIKTIEKAIRSKMNDWLETITDPELVKDLRKNILVSGGSIASMFLDQPVNDYDVYIQNIDVLKRLAIYYVDRKQSSTSEITLLDGRSKKVLLDSILDTTYSSYSIAVNTLKEDQIKLYFQKTIGGLRTNEQIPLNQLNYTPLYYSANAISLSNDIQVVLRFHGNAEQIHKSFDYIHATNYFTFNEGVVTNLPAVESLLTKQLKYQGSYFPITSIIRAKKFIKRGFNISAGEMLKIAFQISELNLSDPDILEEQLIGVDVAYFSLLIDALRVKQESDKDFKLTSSYLNTIIDKVFNDINNHHDE